MEGRLPCGHAAQILSQRLRARVASEGVLLHALANHGPKSGGDRVREGVRLLLHGPNHEGQEGLGFEGWPSAQEAVEGRPEPEHVAGLRDPTGLPRGLLGGPVAGRPHVDRGLGQALGLAESVQVLGEPKVGQERPPAGFEEDVVGLEVAVEEPQVMDRLQRVGDLRSQERDLLGWEGPPARHLVLERLAFDQLQDEIWQPLVLARLMDRDHVPVADLGQHRAFAEEALPGCRLRLAPLEEELDRDDSTRGPLVVGPQHSAHAALPDQALDPVGPDLLGELEAPRASHGGPASLDGGEGQDHQRPAA